MKNNHALRYAFRFICTSLMVIMISACAQSLLTEPQEQSDITSGGLVPVYIGLGTTVDTARTIAPPANPAVSKYRLFYGIAGGSLSLLAEFDSINASTKVNVLPGTYDFKLTALDAEGKTFLECSRPAIAVSSLPVSLSFELKILGTGDGTIRVTATWPASVPVAQVVPVFAGVSETAIPVTAQTTCTYTREAPKGGYLLKLSFRDASGLEIASIPEFVRVYPNMLSAANFTLAAGDFNAPPAAPASCTAASTGATADAANATVNLTWTDSSLNESGFEISYSDNSGGLWTVLSTSIAPASTAYSTPVPRGIGRIYRVRAVNAFGSSSWTETSIFSSPYVVTFAINGGSTIPAVEVAPGGKAIEPAAPTKYGSLFGGWYGDDGTFATVWDFASGTINANTTVYAKWTKAIILEPNRGSGTSVTLNWADGTTANLPANTFTRTGYTFVGWSKQPLGAVLYADAASYTMTTGDTLYARWVRSDATASTDFTTVANGEGLTITVYKPTTGTNVKVVIPK